jgi:hypothetical protein
LQVAVNKKKMCALEVCVMDDLLDLIDSFLNGTDSQNNFDSDLVDQDVETLKQIVAKILFMKYGDASTYDMEMPVGSIIENVTKRHLPRYFSTPIFSLLGDDLSLWEEALSNANANLQMASREMDTIVRIREGLSVKKMSAGE